MSPIVSVFATTGADIAVHQPRNSVRMQTRQYRLLSFHFAFPSAFSYFSPSFRARPPGTVFILGFPPPTVRRPGDRTVRVRLTRCVLETRTRGRRHSSASESVDARAFCRSRLSASHSLRLPRARRPVAPRRETNRGHAAINRLVLCAGAFVRL